MRHVVCYVICVHIAFLLSCQREACQSPPPTSRLILTQSNGGYIINDDNVGKISIQYTNQGQLTRVNTIRVSAPYSAIESYEINEIAHRSNDTTHFYIIDDKQVLGTFQLKTYQNTDRCDGWVHVSELSANGRLIPYDNMKPGYTLVR